MLLCPRALWRTIFIVAVAVGISNSTAVAQETGAAAPGPDQATSPPEVVVVAPPYRGPTRSTIGAPILDVSLSATVRTDDLNPLSVADWIELRHRVRDTAQRLCRRLRFQHPIGSPDEFRCTRRAIENTSDQIDAFVVNPRNAPGIESP